jgi:uncharacterized membrane protein
MSSLAFDTHKFVTDLNKAGMETPVAEVLANTYASLLNDRIATKDDIATLEARIIASEERMMAKIASSQLTIILAISAILGSLMVIMQTYS